MSQSVGSERLRKAIERNRKKQAQRSPSGQRASVANPTNTTFTNNKPRKKWRAPFWKSSKAKRWPFRLTWAFSFFLFIQLIFSDGGLTDFWKNESLHQGLKKKHQNLISENMAIREEIKAIKKSKRYQKKLIREHLGVIGPSEYLVLFAK